MNANTHTNETIEMLWRGTLAIAAVAIFAMLPLEAMAVGSGANTVMDNLFCNIIGFITGPVGKGISTIALIIIGVGALMGKVSWGMALIVAIGIALVFGAGSIVDAIGGASQTDCTVGGF